MTLTLSGALQSTSGAALTKGWFAGTPPAPIGAGSRLEVAASGDNHAAYIRTLGTAIQQRAAFRGRLMTPRYREADR